MFLKNLFKKTFDMKNSYKIKNDDGFSLLELVIAISIVLVLTVGGVVNFSGMTTNAKKAKYNQQISELYSVAVANRANGDSQDEIVQEFIDWGPVYGLKLADESSDKPNHLVCENSDKYISNALLIGKDDDTSKGKITKMYQIIVDADNRITVFIQDSSTSKPLKITKAEPNFSLDQSKC